MGRKPRIDLPGVYQHVCVQAHGRRPIFKTTRVAELYLECVEYAQKKHDFTVIAFNVLDNHIHLIIKFEGNMSKVMSRINGRFASRYNQSCDGAGGGSVFRKRYSNTPIEDPAHLVNCFAYVYGNAPLHGYTETPEQRPFTGYRAHLGLEEAPEFLDLEPYREIYGSVEAMKNHVDDVVAGVKPFTDAFVARYVDPLDIRHFEEHEVLGVVSEVTEVPADELLVREPEAQVSMWATCFALARYGRLIYAAIGDKLGVSESSVGRYVRGFKERAGVEGSPEAAVMARLLARMARMRPAREKLAG